jgi:hypothetical protein
MSENSFAGINFSDPNSKNIFKDNNENMCSEWKDVEQKNIKLDLSVKQQNNVFLISGSLNKFIKSNCNIDNFNIKYWAASPPTYNSNYSGSGLPFPNEEVAFYNTPNRGMVEVKNCDFSFSLNYPNSYYKNLGSLYIPPEVNIEIHDSNHNVISNVIKINLGEGLPYRSLTIPPKRNWNMGSMFYVNNKMPLVRTQHQILMDSAYPKKNITPSNFWGLKPPC